jgi:hypothetical protein
VERDESILTAGQMRALALARETQPSRGHGIVDAVTSTVAKHMADRAFDGVILLFKRGDDK